MITYWPSVKQPVGQRLSVSWPSLFRRFQHPVVAVDKLSLPGWAPATFQSDRRLLANVEQVFAVGLDIEGDGAHFDAATNLWAGYHANVHTTHSHTPEAHRYRVVLVTDRPMTAAEYARVRRWAARRSDNAGQPTDPRAADPSRLWFVPGAPPERAGHFCSSTLEGRPMNVDRVLTFEPETVAPPPCPVLPIRPPEASVVDRARAYCAVYPPAISGAHGHDTTIKLASKLVIGFLLDEATALMLLREWNATCAPPWKDWELKHKVRSALKTPRGEPGFLRDRERRHG